MFTVGFNGTLPLPQNGIVAVRHNVTTPQNPVALGLVIQLTLRLFSGNGSVHAELLDSNFEPVVAVSVNTDQRSLAEVRCPGRLPIPISGDPRQLHVLVTGTPLLQYAVDVALLDVNMRPDRPLTFLVGNRVPIFLFFDASKEDLDDGLIEVFAKSVSNRTGEALLVVGAIEDEGCVERDLLFQEYTGFSRLSFSRQGRFALSRGSVPPLRVGRYFAAVALLSSAEINPDTDEPFPLLFTVGLKSVRLFKDEHVFAVLLMTVAPAVAVLIFFALQYWLFPLHPSEGMRPAGFLMTLKRWCGPYDAHVLVMNPFSFSWLTIIVATAFGITTYKYIFETWSDMNESGDRDLCYYNERCYRPAETVNLPLNNLLSNMWYVVSGLGFNAYVAVQEMTRRSGQDFSLFYAVGWCFVAQGLFSALYHVCPSTSTFLFDVTFILGIGVFAALSVYQTGESEGGIKAAKFFLVFFLPLLTANYVGSSVEIGHYSETVFWIVFFAWWLLIMWSLYYYFRHPVLLVPASMASDKKFDGMASDPVDVFEVSVPYRALRPLARGLCATVGRYFYLGAVLFSIIIFLLRATSVIDTTFANTVMGIVIAFATCVLGYVLACRRFAYSTVQRIHLVVLAIASMAIMSYALTFFSDKTYDTEIDPVESRNLNRECVILDYFDAHDLWHFVSAVAILMLAAFVLHANPPILPFHKAAKAVAALDGGGNGLGASDSGSVALASMP